MTDLGRTDALMNELRTEWQLLFEAIERARGEHRAGVSEATITWEVLKESVSLRAGDALDEHKIRALTNACVRMREYLRQGGRDER